jgi:predicted SAM-dependent methyltransferase
MTDAPAESIGSAKTGRTRRNGHRFDIVAATLVSLTVGFSAGKVWLAGGYSLSSLWRTDPSATIIRSYVDTHTERKLQLGAGPHNLAGWLNTDIEPAAGQAYLDATKPFPLPDRSFHYVFSEHLIEHLDADDGVRMLQECRRILVPGGTVRIETPNLRRFIDLFDSSKSQDLRWYMTAKMTWHHWAPVAVPESLILNHEMHAFGHRFLYDPATLRDALQQAGFDDIKEYGAGETQNPKLKGISYREGSRVDQINRFEAMAFEASRP